jgi:hypothetical protein
LNRFATDSQLLLLRAALGAGPTASNAAQRWLEANRHEVPNGFRSLEPASRRLLPMLYRNVKDGMRPEIRMELRAVHHEYWAENQKLLYKLEILLQGLEHAGIPTIILKGAALSVLHYQDMAARPMLDCDVLVPEDYGPRLVQQYLREGWTPDFIPANAPGSNYFYRYRHALDLVHPTRGKIDLHWHVLMEATYRGADRTFWEGSVPLRVRSVETRALNPTDQLLHACLHGYPFNPMPPIRWIADAVTIMRTSVVDWQRMVCVAGDLGVAVPCAEALGFLNAELDAGVPGETIAKLANHPASAAERRFFRRMADPGARRWWQTLEDVWTANGRASRDRPFWSRVAALPRHLQWQQELSSLASLIPHTFVFLERRFR